MTKTSYELEREVEDARGRIDQTVEALKDKMQPREMFDEATRMMSGASNKVLTTAVDQLRENPVPVALIGLGIAWLALSQTRRGHHDGYSSGYYPTHEGYDGHTEGVGARLAAGAGAAKAKLTRAADRARDGLADVRDGAVDGVEHARDRAAELAHEAQDRAVEYARAARQRFDDTLDHEPLVIGAIGLAVGAAIGAAIPASPVERRYFGPAREKVAERARESLGEVKDVAQRAYGQVKDELHRQTGPEGKGASLVEKAEAIASAGAQSLKDEIGGQAPA